MPVRSLDPLVVLAAELVLARVPLAHALVLGGSQARGEATWVEVSGRRVCLSDIDLHLIVADAAAGELAGRALNAARASLSASLEAHGLAAPLEVGVHTEDEWATMPARPSTLELRRDGCVIEGGDAWLDRLPTWTPRDVPREEIRLLLENRAFELIAARPSGARPTDELAGWRAAHAQYKCALDLALVACLQEGRDEAGAEDRVRVARAARGGSEGEEPAWESALAWTRGGRPADAARKADWARIARGWVAAWSRAVAPERDPGDFEGVARAAAGRARLRRRMRMALRPGMRRGFAPPLSRRLGHAFAGTPQHRLNASAGAFLAAQIRLHDDPASAAAVRAKLARALRRLGAVAPGPDDAVAAALLDTWHRWILVPTRISDRP